MAAPFAGHTITASGAIHSSNNSVFGGSSMFFDGTDDYLSFPADSEFTPGSRDFTYEFWMNMSDTGTQRLIGGNADYHGFTFAIYSQKLRIQL